MLFQRQAVLQHVHVHEGRQHADHQVVFGDERASSRTIRGIQGETRGHRGPLGHQHGGMRRILVRHRDAPLLVTRVPDQVTDQGGGRSAGAKDQDAAHGSGAGPQRCEVRTSQAPRGFHDGCPGLA
jgi:hypothetical protein